MDSNNVGRGCVFNIHLHCSNANSTGVPMTDTLIARLEEATEGSRELSDECLLAVGFAPVPDALTMWTYPNGDYAVTAELPDPSQNVQDAIDWMVPEGCPWEMKSVGMVEMGTERGPVEGIAATPALALCVASLKARQADG